MSAGPGWPAARRYQVSGRRDQHQRDADPLPMPQPRGDGRVRRWHRAGPGDRPRPEPDRVGCLDVRQPRPQRDRPASRRDRPGRGECPARHGRDGHARPAFWAVEVMAALSGTAASTTTTGCTSSNATVPMTFQTSWAALTSPLKASSRPRSAAETGTTQKLPPAGVGVPDRSWRGPMTLQDPSNGRGTDAVAEFEQLALDPCVPPAWVLPRHLHHQCGDDVVDRWSSGPVGVGPSSADEAAMPSQDRVRGDQAMAAQCAGQPTDEGG